MATRRRVIVLATLLAVAQLFSECSATGSSAVNVERSAKLVHGNVKTTRMLATSMRGRKLTESADAAREQVWLIGFPSDAQPHVHSLMKGMPCQVLHPLPGTDDHHWMISASQRTVVKLLDAHPDLTAALLPNGLKLSPELKDAVADNDMQDGEVIMLDVLMPQATTTQVQEAMSTASKVLPKLLQKSPSNTDCSVKLQAAMHGFMVSVCGKDVAPAAAWLASQRGVTWIDIHHDIELYNLHASAAIQSPDSLEVSQPGDNEALIRQGVAGGLFPLWAAGLDGTGQIAGVVDSGLDTDSCFFYDDAIPNPLISPNNTPVNLGLYVIDHPVLPNEQQFHDFDVKNHTNVKVFEDLSHRKVVQLVQFADGIPDLHGTHVSGSVAGAAFNMDPLNDPLLATGAAPGAKLAFYDIGPAGGKEGSLTPPFFPDIIYGIQHKVGARVSCNSWGSPNYKYNPQSYRFDAYTWKQQDMLLAFAAANDGEKQLNYQSGTIGSPGNSKNVLTVGAGENWIQNQTYIASKGGKVGLPLIGPAAYDVPTTSYNFLDLNNANVPYVQVVLEDPTGATRSLRLLFANPRSAPPLYYFMMTNAPNDLFPGDTTAQSVRFLTNSDFGSQLPQGINYPVVFAPPSSTCQPITVNLTGQIVLISKSSAATECTVQDSMINTYNAGAAGVMIYYPDVPGDVLGAALGFYQKVASFPAATLPGNMGLVLEFLSGQGNKISIRTDPPAPAETIPIENVAVFSSWGSNISYTVQPDTPLPGNFTSLDVRIKPDVIAPGWILSAWTDGQITGTMDQCQAVMCCNQPFKGGFTKVLYCTIWWTQTYNQGTSMATPIVTGAAAIVRQYYEDGYYPTGDRSTGVQRSPSAPLVKATLIAGTAAMTGISRTNGYPLDPPPSQFQGFGRVDLSASLPIAGSGKGWSMQVVDGANMTAAGDTHTYTLTATASNPAKPLIVTLVWNDYPGFPGNPYVLVNNLDLTVTGPDGTVLWGNNRDQGDIQNNVEKVYIAQPAAGAYTITVTAKYIYADGGPQPYALVALGGFTGTLDTPAA